MVRMTKLRGELSILAGFLREHCEEQARSRLTAKGTSVMKQYLLGVYSDESAQWTEEQMQASYKAVDEFNQELMGAGAWVFAGGLHPSSAATVVRAQGGKVVITDGPYAETKEHVGGFWVITAEDLDAALAWAAKGAEACGWPVEVRPFQDIPEE
jgi:hypothetical protein